MLERLTSLDESPWAGLRGGKPLDARGLAMRLKKYGVEPTQYRDSEGKHRGYRAADLADPWARYLPPEARPGSAADSGPEPQRPTPPAGHCPTCWEDLTKPGSDHMVGCPAERGEP